VQRRKLVLRVTAGHSANWIDTSGHPASMPDESQQPVAMIGGILEIEAHFWDLSR